MMAINTSTTGTDYWPMTTVTVACSGWYSDLTELAGVDEKRLAAERREALRKFTTPKPFQRGNAVPCRPVAPRRCGSRAVVRYL